MWGAGENVWRGGVWGGVVWLVGKFVVIRVGVEVFGSSGGTI